MCIHACVWSDTCCSCHSLRADFQRNVIRILILIFHNIPWKRALWRHRTRESCLRNRKFSIFLCSRRDEESRRSNLGPWKSADLLVYVLSRREEIRMTKWRRGGKAFKHRTNRWMMYITRRIIICVAWAIIRRGFADGRASDMREIMWWVRIDGSPAISRSRDRRVRWLVFKDHFAFRLVEIFPTRYSQVRQATTWIS